MNDVVGKTLAQLVKEDPSLRNRPRRLEGLLRDLHADAPKEVSAIVEVHAMGMCDDPDVARLAESTGLTWPLAAWALAVWGATRPAPSIGRSVITNRPGTLQEVLS
jgi:hypothetical protein